MLKTAYLAAAEPNTRAPTGSPATPRVDLPELDAPLKAGGGHRALAGVGLSVAGTQRVAFRWARLGRGVEQRLAGERLHPAHGVQAVLAAVARVCGDTRQVSSSNVGGRHVPPFISGYL